MASVAGIILAGGKSSRMGEDKSRLQYNGKSLLEHTEKLLHDSGVEQVYINNEDNFADEIKEKGPLGGVHKTLKMLEGKHDQLLYIPIDMPSLQPALLEQLISTEIDCDIMRFENYMFPFKLRADATQIAEIEEILRGDDYSLKNFQQSLSLHKLPIDQDNKACFANINTAEEWHEFTN